MDLHVATAQIIDIEAAMSEYHSDLQLVILNTKL
jgi:hypothetical protein